MECLGSGMCGIVPCADGSCPVSLFGCGESGERCARIDCSAGAGACPSGTSCIEGICIEARAL
jgi:hypothetical protein